MRAVYLVILVLLAGCARNSKPAERAGIDATLQAFVPKDTTLLLATRVDKLRATSLYQKYFEPRRFASIEEFAARTGIDPSRDLAQLLYLSNGTDGAFIGRGIFSDDARQRLKTREDAAMLTSNLAGIGPPSMLQSMHVRGSIPRRFDPLLARIPPGSQFWAVFDGRLPRLPVDTSSNLDNLNRLLGSVRTGFFYADFEGTGLISEAEAICASEKAAGDLLSSMRAIVSLARAGTKPNQPGLLAIYDSIQITQAGSTVSLRIDAPQSSVENFLDVWMGRAQ